MKKSRYLLSSVVVLGVTVNASAAEQLASAAQLSREYASPYCIKFDIPVVELLAPDKSGPRNDRLEQSSLPYQDWYDFGTRKKFGSWGPPARTFPALPNLDALPLEWKQQRLIAVAMKYVNLPYQHHHIPDWNPPQPWPWRPVPYGKNSCGLDCSNFTAWIYNYGLGIKFTSDVHKQSELTQVQHPFGKKAIDIYRIAGGTEYGALVKELRPGDLLYISHKDQKDRISHVVMWLGKFGYSPDATPLIIDSTAQPNTDYSGAAIPDGVQIRPFTPTSWYFQRFHHASRILH